MKPLNAGGQRISPVRCAQLAPPWVSVWARADLHLSVEGVNEPWTAAMREWHSGQKYALPSSRSVSFRSLFFGTVSLGFGGEEEEVKSGQLAGVRFSEPGDEARVVQIERWDVRGWIPHPWVWILRLHIFGMMASLSKMPRVLRDRHKN